MVMQQQQQSEGEHHALSLDGVVENVLRFLPQDHRLGFCSCVCTRWHAAAVAVTAEAGLLLPDCGPASEAWLQKHCSHLQALVVCTGSLCGSGDTSSIAGLHQLTRLELNSVTSKPALLKGIGDSMKGLHHLGLVRLCWGPLISTASRDELSAAANKLWQGCNKLTYLQAEQCDLNDDCVTSLCESLPELATLDLSRNSLSEALSLGTLPAGLTSLCLGGNSEYLDATCILSSSCGGLDSNSARHRAPAGRHRAPAGAADAQVAHQTGSSSAGSGSGTGCLPALRALDINSLTLRQPHVLAELTALTWLNVDDVAMPEPGDLLSALPQLLQLQQLNMMGCMGGRHEPVSIHALQAALQPLTQLTALDLGNNAFGESGDQSIETQPQQQLLFAELLLPRLQVLGVSDMCWHRNRVPLFTGADIAHMAVACPVLAWLRMHRSLTLSDPTDLAPLTGLSASLTRLDMDSEHQLEDVHLQSIAALKALCCLEVSGVGAELTDRGLLALTALARLTFLRLANIMSDGVSQEVLPKRGRKGPRGPPGDTLVLQPRMNKHGHVTATVSQQLKEHCSRSPQLWKELQLELTQELKAAKKDARDARKEAASERQRASLAQKQARKAQRQAAAAQDEVTALRQQLEALQSQLQQSQDSQGTGASQ